jgi:hypothetical protein
MSSDALPMPVVRLAWRLTIGAALIYLATAGGSLGTKDAVVMFEQTRQLLDYGTFALPERVLGARQHVGTDGRSYSPFGIGQSIYNIPFFLAGRALWASGVGRSLPEEALTKAAVALGATIASAAIVGLSFVSAWRLASDASASLQAALLVGFGTLVWPYSKFGFNAPLAALAVLSAVHFAQCAAASNRTRTAALAGASLAAALLTRHELGFVGIPITAWWIYEVRGGRATWRALTAFIAMWALGVVCWMAYNGIRFGSPWRTGYRPRFGSGGALGLIVSPEGSIVAYMPIVVAGVYGIYVLFKRRRSTALLIATASLTMFAFYTSLDDWLGTRSFGPRYLVVITPLLVVPVAVLLAGWSGPALRRATMVLGVASVLIQVPSVLVDFTKARVDTIAREAHLTYRASDRQWRSSSIAHNVRRAMEQVPSNLRYLTGRQEPPPAAPGASLAQRFAYSLDLWWLYLFYMRVLSAPAALAAGLTPFIAGVWLIATGSRTAARIDMQVTPAHALEF